MRELKCVPTWAFILLVKDGFDYTKLSYNSIVEKVFDKTKQLCDIEYNKKDGWRVRIPNIIRAKTEHGYEGKKHLFNLGKLLYFYDGMKDNKPWYDFYQKNQFSKITPEITYSILFDSELCCKNFIDSLQNTNFGKYVTHQLITNNHINNRNILWLGDYNTPWTDEMLCKHFEITGYINDNLAEPNSEWELILNTINEYKE